MFNKAKQRFIQRVEEMTNIEKPQCIECDLNIDATNCKQYKPKPEKYKTNKEKCPFKC